MKKLIPLLFGLGLLFTSISFAAAPPGFRWNTVWSDEFNYTGSPDPAKWGYELGYKRNNEAQWYTNSKDNVWVKDGVCTITALKLSTPVVDRGKSYWYTSASIHTKDKYAAKYGRIEMSAKIPKTLGVWPAFWLLAPGRWPDAGEIDIMEYFPSWLGINTVSAAFHYNSAKGGATAQYLKKEITPFDGFHNYALEWDTDSMKFYYDNTLYGTLLKSEITAASGTTPFDNPEYLLLNLALGGTSGKIDPSLTSEQYQIDYVRVSQLVAVPPTTSPSSQLAAEPEPTRHSWLTGGIWLAGGGVVAGVIALLWRRRKV